MDTPARGAIKHIKQKFSQTTTRATYREDKS
jgi:hypothetical protein